MSVRIQCAGCVENEWLFRPIGFGYHLPVEDVTQGKLQVNKPPLLGPNAEVLPQMHQNFPTYPSLALLTQSLHDTITHLQKGNQAFTPHKKSSPPSNLPPFQSLQPTNPPTTKAPKKMPPPNLPPKPPPSTQTPHERAQAKNALRAQRQREERAKHETAQLAAERRSVVDALKAVTATHQKLLRSLEHLESENERWRTPNGNLGEIYRLKDEIEHVETQTSELHRRWDELGERIEEKHIEIAFGGSGDD